MLSTWIRLIFSTGLQSILSADGVEFYSIGFNSAENLIVIARDAGGWNSGRTRNIADYFAGQRYRVVVPKLLQPTLDGGIDGDGMMLFSIYFCYFFL